MDMDTDSSQQLRRHRKKLVLAAENVMQGITTGKNSGKTQLNRLIAVCNEAACTEEIANYLRYQAGRKSGDKFWDVDLVTRTIETLAPVLADLPGDKHVDAWKLYAVYMTRAFTYEDAKHKSGDSGQKKSAHNARRRP